MEMTRGEMIDKFTILAMKAKYSTKMATLFNRYYKEIIQLKDSIVILPMIIDLAQVNAKIWENEAKIREEFTSDPAMQGAPLSFEGVGRIALLIRGYNKERVELINQINEYFGDPNEIKINHVAEITSSEEE